MSTPALDVDFCRQHFPALNDDWAFLENAGGTLVPTQVMDRVNAYMTETQVQPGFSYTAAALASERIKQGREGMAALINADPAEIVLGGSTTGNVYVLSHAIRPWLVPGDEVIVTNQDHEANSGAWRRLAEIGVIVKEWRMNEDSAELELAELEKLLSERTRIVCFTFCSNVVATIYDVKAITERVHEAGALVVVDAVAYAGHRRIDVKALDVDFLLCSLYKFFGPHMAMLYGKREHLDKAENQCHYFIGDDDHGIRFNPGGINHELGAAAAGIIEYFDAVHAHHYPGANVDLNNRLERVYELFAVHEESTTKRVLDYLSSKSDVRLIGRSGGDRGERVAVNSFVVNGRSSEEVARKLWERDVAVGAGDFYAARCIDTLGLRAQDGVVRASMVHYNSHQDVDKLLSGLDEVL